MAKSKKALEKKAQEAVCKAREAVKAANEALDEANTALLVMQELSAADLDQVAGGSAWELPIMPEPDQPPKPGDWETPILP